MKAIMTGVVFVLMAGSVFALPSFTHFGFDLPVPGAAVSKVSTGYQFVLGGKMAGEVSMTTSFNPALGHWSLLTESGFYRNSAVFDVKGRIVSGFSEVMSGELASRMGMDRRTIDIRSEGLRIESLRNGRRVGFNMIELDKPIMDVDSMPVILSEFLKTRAESFNSDIVLKSKGWRVNVNFQYFKPQSGEITGEEKSLPPEYRSILDSYANGYHCYRMQAAGLLGLLEPTKYYFLFDTSDTRRFIGFWGGRGEMMEGMVFEPEGGS